MGFGSRLGMAVVMAVAFALVGGAMWFVVVPALYGSDLDGGELAGSVQDGASDVFGGAVEIIGGAADGIDGAADLLGGAADGIDGASGGLGDAMGGLGEAADGLGEAAGGLGDAVANIVPGDGPAVPAGVPELEGADVAADSAATAGEKYVKDVPGYKETATHRYVMYPPCAAMVDEFGYETRTIFGIPTGMPINPGHYVETLDMFDPNAMAAKGYAPKDCKFDHNGNNLGDGWEDLNNDGYADGFTDCTKPYVHVVDEDGLNWYVRELGRDCKYGAPPTRAYENTGSGSGSGGATAPSSSSSSSSSDSGTPENIPYSMVTTGTITRVIDGDTIQVDGSISIRLALVDAPERGEPGYEEATAFTRAKCPVGTTVIYDEDDGQRQGSYGRVIALVWCTGHGTEQAAVPLNALLLAGGHAEIDRRFCNASEFGDDEWALQGGC